MLVPAIADLMSSIFRHTFRQDGFTFNELLVAMSIVVVGVLGYFLTNLSVIRGNRSSDNHTVAINLAQDKMEELKALTQLINEYRCPGAGDRGITAVGALGGIFDRCWKVSDSSLGTHLKQIDVTVSWHDYENREVILSTLVYKG